MANWILRGGEIVDGLGGPRYRADVVIEDARIGEITAPGRGGASGVKIDVTGLVIVGGTSLLGGRGRLVGTLGAVIVLALAENLFIIVQVPATLNDLIGGIVVLAVVAPFVWRMRR